MHTVKQFLVTTAWAAVAGLVMLACESSKPLGPEGADIKPVFDGTHLPPLPTIPSDVGIAGLGTLTTGGGTQSFDFDVRDDLTGRLFYTDSRFDASLTVDGDPLTRIIAFRDGSRFCADPTRGAEFDGTGRVVRQTGTTYEAFSVAACDNGAAGSGTDFFRIHTATEYFNEGFLASGDIVKSGTAATTP